MNDGKTIFLFEHGINSVPSDWRDWTNRAIEYINTSTPYKADSLEYFATALNVRCEKGRTLSFAKKLRAYSVDDWNIIGVAHSNGTRIWTGGWKLAGWPRIKTLHLVCGACDSNFERLGINSALYSGKVSEIFAYTAGKDWAMKIENTLLGRFLFDLSNQPLGLVGPQMVRDTVRQRVRWVTGGKWKEYGHSDCWLPENFESTMKCFLPN